MHFVFVCTYTGEVISEGIDDVYDTRHYADRDDILNEENHIAAVSTKGKAEVQLFAVFYF